MRFEERLDLIKGAGFVVTGIGLGAEEDLVRAGKRDLMADLARERGLEVEYVHAPEEMCNDLWSRDAGKRREALAVYSDAIGYCRKQGVGILVIHVSKSKGVQPDGPNHRGLAILHDLTNCAEDSGVRIAVENTQKEEFVDYVLDGVESQCLGLCYDSSHDFLYGGEPGRLLRQWGSRLMTTHIGDNDGRHDRHWLPGEGGIRWEVVKRTFAWGSYGGCLNLEVFPRDGGAESPAGFVAHAYKSIGKLHGFLTGERDHGTSLGNAREGI